MRSASGSVAITTSALSSAAKAMPADIAACSSGLGEAAYGKSPSGHICSGTAQTCSKPQARNALGTIVMPVPCKGV